MSAKAARRLHLPAVQLGLLGVVLTCLLFFAATPIAARAASRGTERQREWSEFNHLIAHAQAITMTHPDVGIQEARRAAAIAQSHKGEPGYRRALATALWLEAETLTRTNRIAEARAVVATASRLADDGRLTKLDGDLALSRARIAESSGDFANALKNYQRAHDIFAQLGISRSQSLTLLGLGDLYEKARDFTREIRYYREAAQAYSGDPAIALAAANNLGFAYEQMGHYREAIPRFEQALNIAK